MMKAWTLIGLCALAVMLAGCAPVHQPTPAPQNDRATASDGASLTVRMSILADPLTMDPNLAAEEYSIMAVEQMFLGLTNLDNRTQEIKPELAKTWDVSADGLTWTFHLRDDVAWSDGKPVTAKDIEYSVRRAVKPETASPYAYVLYRVKNAQTINQTLIPTDTYDIDTVGVKALDDYTVQFKLEAPASYFESISSLWTLRPVPSWAIEEFGDRWTDPANIVVNGPYKLTEWKPNEKLTFEKNPAYVDKDQVQIERFELLPIADQNTQVAMYENGDIDVTSGSLPAEALRRIRSDPALHNQLHEVPRADTNYIGFTMVKPPFDDARVRKAFSAAIDRLAIVQVLGAGTPATQFAPPGIVGAPDPEIGISYNPEQARAWLAEAGYPGGAGFPTVTYRYGSNTAANTEAEALQAMWKEVLNVDVRLQPQEGQSYLMSLISPTDSESAVEELPELWGLGWFADYPDENNWVYEVFHCTDSLNIPHAPCSAADELAAEAGRTTDLKLRQQMYRQVEQMMFAEEVRAAPEYHEGFAILTKPYLERTYPSFAPVNWDTWRIRN